MNLKLDNSLQEEYDYCKSVFKTKVNNGYRKSEIIKLRTIGFSDDDIFMADILGIAKGFLESDLMDGLK